MGILKDKGLVSDNDNDSNSQYLGASDFEGEGLTVKLMDVKKYSPSNPNFGHPSGDEVLEKGETLQFVFKTKDGVVKKFDNHGKAIRIGIDRADAEAGDWLHIKRTGQMQSTRYHVKVVEQEENIDEVAESVEKMVSTPPVEEMDEEDTPF